MWRNGADTVGLDRAIPDGDPGGQWSYDGDLSVIKTRPLVQSRPWSKPESTLRRLRPDVPVVKTADTRQSEDPGGGGGPGLDWAAIW